MLSVRIPSNETYRIGTRPAVFASIDKVLEYFNINIDQEIWFNGEAEVSKLLGGDKDGKRGSDLATDFGYSNKLFIELERTESGYNDELDAYSGNNGNPPLWYDPISKASIVPKFITRKYEVTVNALFKDRVTAERYVTNIRRGVMSPHQNTLFNVDTHFPVTDSQLQCYYEIYQRLVKVRQVEATKPFLDWMEDNSQVPIGILRNAAYKAPVFVFKQQIADVGLNMENPNTAIVNVGAYIGNFQVSFKYSFYWAEHTEWIFNYPIQVYQQPMPLEYLPDVFINNKEEYVVRRFYESAAAARVWDYNKLQAPFYHVFPSQDNWRPEPTYWVSPQLQVLVNVEDQPNQVLINLNNIDGFTWNPTVLGYLMRYRNRVTFRHKNPMNIAVWSDDGVEAIKVLEEQIVLQDNGDLILTRNPRMSNSYRVVISFDYALRLYDEDCVNDLLEDPDYGRWIIGELFPQYPLPDNWGDGGMNDWEDVYNGIIVGDGPAMKFYMPYGMLYSLIVAKNSASYQKYLQLKQAGKLNGSDFIRWDQTTR